MASVLVTATFALVTAAPSAATAAGAAPPYTLDERAAAIASPALVFVEARLEGFMRVRATGALVTTAPVVIYRQCSGFVVSQDGHVVTTTHCLQPSQDSMRGAASFVVANDLIRENKLRPERKAAFIAQLKSTADFTGTTPDTAPKLTVRGQLFVGTAESANAPSIAGRVVDMQPTAKGDAALVKLDQVGLPVTLVAPDPPAPDTHVVMLGFGTNDQGSGAVTYTVQSRSGRILGTYGKETPTRFRLDGDIGSASHGGMVVDSAGRALGMITADMESKDRVNQIVTSGASIATLITNSEVENTLSDTDRTYRAGLDSHFGGRYSEAIKKFDTVLAATPGHLPAQSYRRQSADRLAIEGDPTTNTINWVLAGVAAIAVLTLIVVIVVVVVRGRARRAREQELARFNPYPPVSGAPISGLPISGMPTSGTPTSGAPTSGAPTPGIPQPGSPEATESNYPMPVPRPTPDQPTDQTSAPGPTPPAAAGDWPALPVWRNPHRDPPVPPPIPAPNTSSNSEDHTR